MKKIISLLLAGIMLLSVMTIGCVGVSAAQTHTSGDYNYQFVEDSETVKITAYTGKNTDLQIPSTLDGYEVSEIGNGAFYINKTLEYVTLPDTIKKIGSDAFKLTDIVEITFNDNLTHIGSLAFYNCAKLKKVKLPDSLKVLDENVFGACTSLTTVTLPENDNFTTIPNKAFSGCSSLKSISIPDNITTIGHSAFSSCNSLTSVVIPESITSIGSEAFSYCGLLNTVDLSKAGITELPSGMSFGVFHGCENLTTVTLPTSGKFTTIGDHAFEDCTALQYSKDRSTPFYIPDSVTNICESAFNGCDSLSSIVIPDGVKKIGMKAFYGCNSLADVKLNNGLRTIDESAFDSCKALKSIDIPDTVTTINKNAFYNSGLETVIIPDSVDTLNAGVFNYCTYLQTVQLPENEDFTSIFKNTFYNCSELKSIDIPDTVTHIDDFAFYNSGITEIVLSESVVAVSSYSLSTSSLEKVTFLNPDCVIYDENATIGFYAVIYGYENSTAQAYAEKYNRTFVSLGEVPVIPEVNIGDANGDGEVNITDATLVQRNIARLVEFTEEQKIAADTNKDGEISVVDATIIQRFVAKLIEEF